MKKKGFGDIDKVLQPYYRLKFKLNQQNMYVSDVKEILKITERQIFYWDQKGKKLTEKKTPTRAWRNFSIIDILGFAMIKELRLYGLKLNQCDNVFDWFCRNLDEALLFLYHLAEGDSIYLFIERGKNWFFHYYGTELSGPNTLSSDILHVTTAGVFLPLQPIFKAVFEQIKREDFHAEFTKDNMGGSNKIIFYIDGDRTELKLSKDIIKTCPDIKIFKSSKGYSIEETILFIEEN